MEIALALAAVAVAALALLAAVAIARRESPPPPALAELDRTVGELAGRLERFTHDHRERSGELRERLVTMSEAQSQVSEDQRKLLSALRRPGVRGQWGEVALRNVVEHAGLTEHVDFDIQAHVRGDGDGGAAAIRPDMVVRLPGGGELPTDAKVPLDHFQDAIDAGTPEAREAALAKHVQAVRAKVRELSGKAYWERFRRAPEMVVMFVASEAAFAAAVERDPSLLQEAARKRVVITTPTTMIGLLFVAAFAWQERGVSENAEQIRKLAGELVERLRVVGGHLDVTGKALERAVKAHNSAVGSYESRLLPTAGKMGDLGISAAAGLEEPARVSGSVRQLSGDSAGDEQPR